MELSEMIKVMQHYENGGEIECKSKNTIGWRTTTYLSWDWNNYTYRIKEPKQKVTIEKWLGRSGKGDYIILEASNVNLYKGYELVKLIESYEVEL